MQETLKVAMDGVKPAPTENEWDSLDAALEKAYAVADPQSKALGFSTSSNTSSELAVSYDETHGLKLAEFNKSDTEWYWKMNEQVARKQPPTAARPPSKGPGGISPRGNPQQPIRAGKTVIKAVKFEVVDHETRAITPFAANDVPDQVRAWTEAGDQRALVQWVIALRRVSSSKARGVRKPWEEELPWLVTTAMTVGRTRMRL